MVAGAAVGSATSTVGAVVAPSLMSENSDGGPMGYFVDSLFRRPPDGALWLFVSLLIGAFVASLSATYGGRRRDA